MQDDVLTLAPPVGAASGRSASPNLAQADFVCHPMRFPGVLTAEQGRAAAALGDAGQRVTAGLTRPIEGYRKGATKLLVLDSESKWLYVIVRRLLLLANQWYRFDIDTMVESLLYCEYPADGAFDWHMDCGEAPTSTRKISLSLQLSDAPEYDGGALEFAHYGELKESRRLGTAVVFPAFVQHRVAPVTRGMRRSLVAWAHGPVFR